MEDLKNFYFDIIDKYPNSESLQFEKIMLENIADYSYLSVGISIYYELINNKEYELAYKLIEEVNKIYPSSMLVELAYLYQYGYGIEKNIPYAISLYEEAYNKKSREAACSLGLLYKDIDINKAIYWFEKGTHTMNATYGEKCCYELGMIYYEGNLMPKNLNTAYHYFKLGCFHTDFRCRQLYNQCFIEMLEEKENCIYFEINGYFDGEISDIFGFEDVHYIMDKSNCNGMNIPFSKAFLLLNEIDNDINVIIKNILNSLAAKTDKLKMHKIISNAKYVLHIHSNNQIKLSNEVLDSVESIGCDLDYDDNLLDDLFKYIKNNYKSGKEIYIEDLEKYISKEILSKDLPKLIEDGKLEEYSNGIFYMPENMIVDYDFNMIQDTCFKPRNHSIEFKDIIKKKYIYDGEKRIGYLRLSNFNYVNINDFRNHIIYTNKDIKEKEVKLDNLIFYIRKSRYLITEDNYKYLYVLDLIDISDKENIRNNISIIKKLIKDLNINYLIELSKNYNIDDIINLLKE